MSFSIVSLHKHVLCKCNSVWLEVRLLLLPPAPCVAPWHSAGIPDAPGVAASPRVTTIPGDMDRRDRDPGMSRSGGLQRTGQTGMLRPRAAVAAMGPTPGRDVLPVLAG